VLYQHSGPITLQQNPEYNILNIGYLWDLEKQTVVVVK